MDTRSFRPVSYTHLDVYKRQDMYRGLAWFKFISGELPALCRRFFPILSDRREDTFIGGLSMGGYGALKCGLRAPQTFSQVISLSGALDAADTAVNNTVPATRAYWEDVFGPAKDVPGSEHALFAAAETLDASEEALLESFATAAYIGMIISKNATVSGAEGGCQAECGSASAMAAAALAEMQGGSPQQCLDAAAIALKNVMGLVCDPVAGLRCV